MLLPRIRQVVAVAYLASYNGLALAATASADTAQPGNEAAKAIDGNANTFWHSAYRPTLVPLPHFITIDLGSSVSVRELSYQPRQDGFKNGNIGQHTIQTSVDGSTWTTVATGTFVDDATTKVTPFQARNARYVKLTATTEAGGRGPWSSAAEIKVTQGGGGGGGSPGTQGQWGPLINFPLVPAAAANLYDSGQVLTWSAYRTNEFSGGTGLTQTAVYTPGTNAVTQRTITNTQHDMFCPGSSLAINGKVIVTGGNDAAKTSIGGTQGNTWTAGPNMKISRGYQSSASLSDTRIFTIGGSWSGGEGNKNGEIYNVNTNTWTLLSGCPVGPILTADSRGVYRSDNHAWLFGWKGGSVFHAGPSKAMNWFGTSGSGSRTAAGTRALDPDSMNGNAIMYDAVAGKILTVGGSPNYDSSSATSNAHIITIGAAFANPTVTKINSMANARAFHNSVVLPDGKVFVVGGETFAIPFSDDTSILTPELFNPATSTFSSMAGMTVPRNYHSVALLLPDGTVFSGGGGLCGACTTNHFNAQIWRPPYLFNSDGSAAARPVINSVGTGSAVVGAGVTVSTGGAVTKFALVRLSSNTHSVNTDQRRVPLAFTGSGTSYTVTIPQDPGIVIPGYYMLFALNSAGVPSVSRTLQVRAS